MTKEFRELCRMLANAESIVAVVNGWKVGVDPKIFAPYAVEPERAPDA